MKKIFLTVTMLLMMSATAFAGNVGNAFSAEETIAESIINAMVGKGSYVSFQSHLSNELASRMTEEAFKGNVAGIQKQFGQISNVNLAVAQRGYDVNGKHASDLLTFMANSTNHNNLAIDMVFVPSGSTYKVAVVGFRPVEFRQNVMPKAEK